MSTFLEKFAVFNPQGFIAMQQKHLIITAVLLMLIVVVPAYIMLFTTAWKYRSSNRKENQIPEYDHKKRIMILWWAFPAMIILILAINTWHSTHKLDPRVPLVSANKPVTIQVVALPWKWLFIYPEQNIATVNFVEIPENTPIHFELTADDMPMSSMWIPQLGGQMYAMTGMSSQINLMANTTGEFHGASAEINGPGYAGMQFITKSVTQADFDAWLTSAKASSKYLTTDEYNMLAMPSENNAQATYSQTVPGLYDAIMMKYMSSMDMYH